MICKPQKKKNFNSVVEVKTPCTVIYLYAVTECYQTILYFPLSKNAAHFPHIKACFVSMIKASF